MRSFLSGAVALAGMPMLAAAGTPGVTVEPPAPAHWVRQQHRNGVFSRLRGYSSSFSTSSAEYLLEADFGWGDGVEPFCKVTEQLPNSVAVPYPGADATPAVAQFDSMESRRDVVLSSGHLTKLYDDAAAFAYTARELAWKPKVWADEGEIVFEWIDGNHHAVVSVEGDGRIGYTFLVDGQFIPGNNDDALVHSMPEDLLEYLTASA